MAIDRSSYVLLYYLLVYVATILTILSVLFDGLGQFWRNLIGQLGM